MYVCMYVCMYVSLCLCPVYRLLGIMNVCRSWRVCRGCLLLQALRCISEAQTEESRGHKRSHAYNPSLLYCFTIFLLDESCIDGTYIAYMLIV